MVADERHALNAFNAAARLPSDILVMIPSFLPTNRDLFAASQVCRLWRTTLASSPSVWRRIDCQNRTQTAISLERHRSVPLQLELHDGFSAKALNAVLGTVEARSP